MCELALRAWLKEPGCTMQCPAESVSECQCKFTHDGVVHGPEATLYPKAGLFRLRNTLFDVRRMFRGEGKHYWEMFLAKPCSCWERAYALERLIYTCIGVDVDARRKTYFLLQRAHGTVRLIVQVWRIQRAVRDYLERKRQSRRLAFVMGLHCRLGRESPVACLPVDVVMMRVLRI